MEFASTRGAAPAVSFSEAALNGLAPDGGLYVPVEFPAFEPGDLDVTAPLPELAAQVLEPFLAGDRLEGELKSICRRAFDFPMPLVPIGRETSLLELFHGPTAAFKDFGARFLAACFGSLWEGEASAPLTVVVATSGDTGAAVASAFHRQEGARVAILFPDGGVAPRQEKQLTCWDDNVRSFAVHGTFDDCQRVVKQTFSRPGWPARGGLSSANSINIGRLLPQAMYYAVASSRYLHETGEFAGFIVPSGNVGNSIGAYWARQMGFPVREIAMAANANRPVPDWFATGRWEPRPSRPTLANAMDVGDPSNMERLFHLFPDREALLALARALSVDDATIREVIAAGPKRWGRVFCPHTATAIHFREQIDSPHWVVVATAHPAKFDEIVEPLIGEPVEVPPRLAELLERPSRVTRIEPDLEKLVLELEAPG